MLPTLDLLGGPFKPVSSTGATTSGAGSDSGAVPVPFDPEAVAAAREVDPGTGVPSAIAAPSDDSQGGSAPTDPREETQAAKDALETPSEEMIVTATATFPEVRPFDDQTFLLMHAHNFVNLRNEKMNFDLDEPPPDKLDDVDGDKKPDDIMSNTIRSIKSGLPYAYIEGEDQPETNAVIQCIGDPGGFVNYLTAVPNAQAYIDSTPSQLSNLTPKIRLYKIFHKDGNEEIVEFAFETAGMGAAELEAMTQSRGRKRGYGAGIKSFNMNFQGDDTATARTLVTGDLILYASSMESFLKVRRGIGESDHLEYRFMDLAYRITTPRGNSNDIPKGHTSDLSFEIVAEVGLATATGVPGLSNDATSLTVKLKPHGHNFDFAQDGSVTMTIEYSGYVDTTFSSGVRFDIFTENTDMLADLRVELAANAIAKDCGTKEATKFRQEMAAIGNSNYRNRITNLNTQLRRRGKIYYINIAPEVMTAFNDVFNSYEKNEAETEATLEQVPTKTRQRIAAGKAIMQAALGTNIPLSSRVEELSGIKVGSAYTNITSQSKQAKSMQNDMEEKAPPQSAIRDCAIDPNSNQVPYFYVSDLINIILENLTSVYRKENLIPSVEALLNFLSSDKGVEKNAKLLGISEDTARNIAVQTDTYDTINKIMINADKLKKFRVVLGPTTIKDFFSENQIVCSIGDIPIPLRHFNSWLVGQMEGQKRKRYPLAQFLADFIQTYVKDFLRGHTKYNDAGNLGMMKTYGRTALFGYKSNFSEYDTDPLTLMRHSGVKSRGRKSLLYQFVENEYRPLIKTNSNKILNRSKKEGFDYMIFHEPKSPFATPKVPEKLSNVGIGVYQLGKDRGILKEVSFARTDIEYMQEAFMKRNGSQDGLAHLTQVFNATLTMYANLNVHVGQFIYIDPESVTSYLSAETKSRMTKLTRDMLGVGGFFFVISVNHSFEQGRFETTLNTQWLSQANMHKGEINRNTQLKEEQVIDSPEKAESDKSSNSACKSTADGPNSSGIRSNTLQQAALASESMFGGIIDAAVGLFKALFDNSESEVTADDVAGITSNLGSKAVSNPDQGNQNSANNGPRR